MMMVAHLYMVAPGVAGDLAEGAHVMALEAVHELPGKQVSRGFSMHLVIFVCNVQ